MKTNEWIILAAAALLCTTSAQAAYLASTDVNNEIPDGVADGLASTINVSIPASQIAPGSLSVVLNISGSYSGDLYAYITHGAGFAVLLNRVGLDSSASSGYGDSGFNVRFSDSAANGNIHYYHQVTTPLFGIQLTDMWAPDGRNVSPYLINGTETPTAMLSSFDGVNPNGEWMLFVADVNGGDVHTLTSWGLEIAAVPEPSSYGLVAAVLAVILAVNPFRRPSLTNSVGYQAR